MMSTWTTSESETLPVNKIKTDEPPIGEDISHGLPKPIKFVPKISLKIITIHNPHPVVVVVVVVVVVAV